MLMICFGRVGLLMTNGVGGGLNSLSALLLSSLANMYGMLPNRAPHKVSHG